MQEEMQVYYEEVMENIQRSCPSPKSELEAEQKLQNMQAALQKAAALADEKLMAREDSLTQLVQEELKQVLAKVAKEQEYTYIIDKKHLLYYEGGVDLTALVKKQLLLQEGRK